MRLALGPLAVAAVAVSLALTACGSEGSPDAGLTHAVDGAADVREVPVPDPGAAAADGLDIRSACELLDVAAVEVAADGLGWGVIAETEATCVYQDPDAVHTVTLTLFDLAQYEAAQASGDAVDAGASGMIAFGEDGAAAVWTRAGGAAAIGMSQEPAVLTQGALVALVEEAALAYENAPLLGDSVDEGPGDGGSAAGAGSDGDGLESVTVTGTVVSTGNDIAITVTAAKVLQVGAPAFTAIECFGGPGENPAAASGAYAVLAMDGTITEGLTLAQLEATAKVEGPGTYGAALLLTEADGDSFSLTGEMTIAESMAEGVYEVEDSSGAVVTGTWECSAAS